MFNLKKTAMAVLALGSSAVFAGTMGPACTPGNVTVPCVMQGWDIGIQALYLKPVYGAKKDYTIGSNPFVPGNSTFLNAPRDWDWGYRLEGSYHFNTGNDATLVWTHYRNTSNDFSSVLMSNGQTPVFLPGVNRNYQNQFDQVNAVLGQHVDMSVSDKLRFYGGLQYAHLSTNFTDSPPANTFFTQLTNTDYRGLGPVIGLDYAYYLNSAFSLTANAASSLLYGKTRAFTGLVFLPPGVVVSSLAANKWALVPSFEAKLGLNYEYAMSSGILNLQGGYQVLDYLNVYQTFGQSIASRILGEASYGLYGPYLGVKYVGQA